MKKIVVVCGPTASGKTGLSIKIAQKLNGEIVSADSMQIFREMNIGTSKVTESEKNGVPHYMLNIVNPDQRYTVAEYVEDAKRHVENILTKGKTPILVGGTGLYVNSLLFNYNFSDASEDLELRANLCEYSEKYGKEKLWQKLYDISPEKANSLHVNDTKRIIRAIEVLSNNNSTPTNNPIYDYDAYMICHERSDLYDRINKRVDLMVEQGLIEEAKNVIEKYNLNASNQSMQAIGYKELLNYFNGSEELPSAIEKIKQGTRNYAKRQITWFRKLPNLTTIAVDEVEQFIKEL